MGSIALFFFEEDNRCRAGQRGSWQPRRVRARRMSEEATLPLGANVTHCAGLLDNFVVSVPEATGGTPIALAVILMLARRRL